MERTRLISADSHVAISLKAIRARVPSKLHEAFDDAGKLRDERKAKQVAKLAADLVTLAAKLKA